MSEAASKAMSGEMDGKHHRRPLLILGGLVFLLLGVLAYVILYHDGPPPDDAHLIPTWSERGSNANPLAVFCKTLVGSSIKDWEKLKSEKRDLDEKSTPEARTFLATHTAEVAAFETLMQTDPATWQWPDAEGTGMYENPFTGRGATEIQALSLVLRSKALQLHEDGRTEEAVALSLQLARMADGLYGAEGASLHLLTAHSTQWGAQATLLKVGKADGVPPAMLREVLQQLGTLKGPSTEQFKKALKVDYAYLKDGIGKFSSRELRGIGNLPQHFEFLAPWFFKSNQTLTLRVQLDTPVLTALDHGWSSMFSAIEAREKSTEALYEAEQWKFFIYPNFVGRSAWLHELTLPRMRSRWNQHNELRLLLALRLHELEHGSLPDTLGALVPSYLPAVPTDIFSGTPFLWNAKLQVLYTVGKNGKDDGGTIDEERAERGLDWGVKYPWSPASSKPAAP
ncbi:hypothetical protein DES53_10394 [Roseimicrobium gellanilyticum]|uniref:Uncharacterized protein n=1 Tax=Roseimicrobium gellanilyticum TaxID=748857 RepID=A0A366HQM7_9BACT|nr:hypothetical protein [Roseimicrobium gellanilyticum]RBP45098.1 hypothetical protein DES53_10394 [Roseimicrobium gellanilyticum]